MLKKQWAYIPISKVRGFTPLEVNLYFSSNSKFHVFTPPFSLKILYYNYSEKAIGIILKLYYKREEEAGSLLR